MALTCPVDLTGVSYGWEAFIDCSTININYDNLGIATLSFTVVSKFREPASPDPYTELTYGGILFRTYTTGLSIRKIPGTLVYEHSYNRSGTGCRV